MNEACEVGVQNLGAMNVSPLMVTIRSLKYTMERRGKLSLVMDLAMML